MFPSLSLNQAVLAPPPLTMLFSILIPGMSYSSNTTPLALSSATSATTSSTAQNAVLAFDVPAPGDGYMNAHEPYHTRRSRHLRTPVWVSVLLSLRRTFGLEPRRQPECTELLVHSLTFLVLHIKGLIRISADLRSE